MYECGLTRWISVAKNVLRSSARVRIDGLAWIVCSFAGPYMPRVGRQINAILHGVGANHYSLFEVRGTIHGSSFLLKDVVVARTRANKLPLTYDCPSSHSDIHSFVWPP
jgi:hypothetical protein